MSNEAVADLAPAGNSDDTRPVALCCLCDTEGGYQVSCWDIGETDTCESDDLCTSLGSFCTLRPGALGEDRDRDGDGINEVVSLGIQFEATPATIRGISST